MITLTSQAAAHIRCVAERSNAEGMFLRVTAQASGGRIVHGMGFDEFRSGDIFVYSEGIPIVVHESHQALLAGTVVDYVPLNSGAARIVYDNPNDVSCASFLGACGGCAEACRL